MVHRWRRQQVCIAFVAAAVSSAAPAQAETTRVVVIGSGPAQAQIEVGDKATEFLRATSGPAEFDRSPPDSLVFSLRGCYGGNSDDCARLAEASGESERILAIELTSTGSSGQDLSLTAWFIGPDGDLLLAERRYCRSCSGDQLTDTVGDLLGYLVAETTGIAARSVIRIKSRPAGAEVRVDGVAVGVTDLEYTVYPGRHEIAIDKPGHRIEHRQVDAPLGATVDVDIRLTAIEGTTTRQSRPLPWVLGGIGVGAVATGVSLMLLDSSATDSQGSQNRSFRKSFWPGVGFAVTGAALVSAGVWLLFKDRGSASASPPVGVSVEPDGLWIVGAGHF